MDNGVFIPAPIIVLGCVVGGGMIAWLRQLLPRAEFEEHKRNLTQELAAIRGLLSDQDEITDDHRMTVLSQLGSINTKVAVIESRLRERP